MNNKPLTELCYVSSGYENDAFVGIKVKSGNPEIHFPIGFSLSKDEEQARKDVFLLIKVLKCFFKREKIQLPSGVPSDDCSNVSMLSYQRIIQHYFDFGEYTEKETTFKKAKRGRIDWSRTIKKIRPMIQNSSAVYTDFIVRDNTIKENTLLSQIFMYCVYISFKRIGWLYSQRDFPKPPVKYSKDLFLNVLQTKLDVTYADNEKTLLYDMIAIISETKNEKDSLSNYTYGTYEFEYVWQDIVDYAYGIKNKQDYFPKTHWHLLYQIDKKPNRCLQPDTIMQHEDKLFVLDGKYYRYGDTGFSNHLPGTESIEKQITYGEFIHKQFKKDPNKIFNAFIMPADLKNGLFKSCGNVLYIGWADSEWKKSKLPYERIAGVLVDTKYLMNNYLQKNSLIPELAKAITVNILK